MEGADLFGRDKAWHFGASAAIALGSYGATAAFTKHEPTRVFIGGGFALAGEELRRLVIKDGAVTHQEVLFKGGGRVRDVVNGPDGYIYLTFDGGRVARLVPAESPATASR